MMAKQVKEKIKDKIKDKSVKLAKNDIAHVSDLIKIHLSEEELDNYKIQLEAALDCASDFNELNTKGVPITSSSIGTNSVYRDDEPEDSLSQNDALLNADSEDDGYFVVKRFINKD